MQDPPLSPQQLSELRRAVRRDADISDGAARLFSEIVDMHMLRGQCFVEDPKLAGWLGCTVRTIRRRRKQLEAAGYLREEHRDGRRYLVPVADPDNSVRTQMSGTSVRSTPQNGQNCPTEASAADTSVREAPDNSVQDREIYIPAEAGESARAREEVSREQANTPSNEPPPDEHPAVSIFAEIIREPNSYERSRLCQLVDAESPAHLDALRTTCRESMDSVKGNTRKINLKYFVRDLRRNIEEAEAPSDGLPQPIDDELFLNIGPAEGASSGDGYAPPWGREFYRKARLN